MSGNYRIMGGIAPMGVVGTRRLEFLLAVMTGQQILEMGSREFRTRLSGVGSNGLHFRGVDAPIIVLGGGLLRFRCLSCLWCAGATGHPARIGQVYVSGQMLMKPKADVLPDHVDFD